MKKHEETGDRRNISPEFHKAVKDGLRAIGSKVDPVVFAKVLWTNRTIEIRERYARQAQEIENPHCEGGNVGCIAATIERMRP